LQSCGTWAQPNTSRAITEEGNEDICYQGTMAEAKLNKILKKMEKKQEAELELMEFHG